MFKAWSLLLFSLFWFVWLSFLLFYIYLFACFLVCGGQRRLHATAYLEVRGQLTKVISLLPHCGSRDPTQVLRPDAMHLTPWAISPTSCFVFLKQGLL